MRQLIPALAALVLLATPALSAQAEGKIRSIDRDGLTITLENGQTYKLPGEFDLDSIQEGMDVVLAFDKVDGQNQITDMDISD